MSSLTYENLGNIETFVACSKPLSISLSVEYAAVSSWQEAQTLCQQIEWENTTLEIANHLRKWLAVHAPKDWDRWNETVIECKKDFESTIDDYLRQYVRQHGLMERVIHCVQWDLVLSLVELRFRQEGMPTIASDILLPIYQAGHFPCGWSGGKFPNGVLHVF